MPPTRSDALEGETIIVVTAGAGGGSVVTLVPAPVQTTKDGRNRRHPQRTIAPLIKKNLSRSLEDSLTKVLAIVEVLEHDGTYVNLRPKGEPQLGRRGLYRNTGGDSPKDFEMCLLWVLNMSDGRHSLLDISERAAMPFATVRRAADALRGASLLKVLDRDPSSRTRGDSSSSITGLSRTPLRSRRRSR